MRIVETVSEMHAIRRDLAEPVAMMATLGGMHAGHEALLTRVASEGISRVASLFLNPTQFDDPADFSAYPHNTAQDLATFERHGIGVVFMPSVEEMYPSGGIMVDPGRMGALLEGAHRPGHFEGVATVVAKILSVLRPNVAVWGAKDAQQNVIIAGVSRGLLLDVRHVIVPTVRDPDGLALSSRNRRLSDDERVAATVLYRGLRRARELWKARESESGDLRGAVREMIEAEPLVRLEYVSLADPTTLVELDEAKTGALLSLAARVGPVRLIDNLTLP